MDSSQTLEIQSLRVTAIIIEGNRKTKAHVILREMKTKVGDVIDREKLIADQKRILNLRLFSRVEIQGVPVEGGVQLLVIVHELWYFYPYPIFFLNDRDWGKISFGVGLLYFNFRGRNEQISASGWAGYNPAVQLEYGNPRMFGETDIFGRWRVFASRTKNRYFEQFNADIDEERFGGSFTLGKRFGLFDYLSMQLSYSRLKFDPPVAGQTLDPSGEDHLPSLGLTYVHDARDLFEYPRDGTYVRLWARQTGFNDEYIHYLRYGADLRRYQKLNSRISIAGRGAVDLSSDKIPIYDLVYLGYANRVRGHFYEERSGENLALGSMEVRITLLPVRYFQPEDLGLSGEGVVKPLLPFFRNWKFGVNAALFADYGLVWNQDEEIDTNRGQSGFGAGLHLHLPVINILRFEIAFNADLESQVILDWGVSF